MRGKRRHRKLQANIFRIRSYKYTHTHRQQTSEEKECCSQLNVPREIFFSCSRRVGSSRKGSDDWDSRRVRRTMRVAMTMGSCRYERNWIPPDWNWRRTKKCSKAPNAAVAVVDVVDLVSLEEQRDYFSPTRNNMYGDVLAMQMVKGSGWGCGKMMTTTMMTKNDD